MNVVVRENNNIKILDFEGKLDTNTAPEADKMINEILNAGCLKLIVNFKNLNYISSAGLRCLLAAAKNLKKVNGDLRVCNLNEVVQEIFDISGFCSILNVNSTEEEALSDFNT
ncbi:STAS domain-containing protein [Bacteroidota bacterium]